MRQSLFLCLLVLIPTTGMAQSAHDEPMAAVTRFFEGMMASDTTLITSTLHPEARLMTALVKPDGSPAIATTPIPAFLGGVAGAAAGSLDERLYDVEVRVDGTMASVWAPYRFYLNGDFSHCGINQFVLVKIGDLWQILQIVDTRRRADCTME